MKSLAGEGYDFEVKWRPYQLAPDISREGRNKREYYDVSAASKPIAICNMLCPTSTVRLHFALLQKACPPTRFARFTTLVSP